MTKRPAPPIGDSTQAYKDIRAAVEPILLGDMLVIDPSVGSDSSMPGYALYEAGVFKEKGTIEIESVGERPAVRLTELGKCLREDFATPDVLVIEKISAKSWDRRRGASGHASLLKSVGTILGTHDWPAIVEIPPRQWSFIRDEHYVKGDANDAEYMGKAVIAVAEYLREYGRGIGKRLDEWEQGGKDA